MTNFYSFMLHWNPTVAFFSGTILESTFLGKELNIISKEKQKKKIPKATMFSYTYLAVCKTSRVKNSVEEQHMPSLFRRQIVNHKWPTNK